MDNIEKGEIVYCNIEFEYQRTNYRNKNFFNKTLLKTIFARKYDCINFPDLDLIKYSMLINKIDRKNSYYIINLKVVNLKILARTGYIARL